MYARFRARWGARPALAAIASVLVVVFAACDTQPATEVNASSAVLNGKGSCITGLKGWWRYQLRDASAGGAFQGVGPQHDFHCGANTGEVGLPGHRATGLTSGHLYQFRIRTQLSNGDAFWQDAAGTRNGTQYDSFRLPAPAWRFTQGGGDASNDPPLCDDGSDSCASASGRRCKGRFDPLRNVHTSWVEAIWTADPWDEYPLWGAQTLSAWCWYSPPHQDAGRIYWRNTTSNNWSDSPFGGVSFGSDYWYSSGCFDGNRWCLTRREVQAIIGINLPGGLPDLADHQWICIATRVSSNTSDPHGRAIHKSRCHEISGASTAGVTPEGRNTPAMPAPGEVVTIRSVGDAAMRRRVAKACASSYAVGRASSECKAAAKAAYLALTPAERRMLGKARR